MARFEPYNYNNGLNPFLAQINQNPELINLDDTPASTPSRFMLFSDGALVNAHHNNSHFSPNLLHGEDFFLFFGVTTSSYSSFKHISVHKLDDARTRR